MTADQMPSGQASTVRNLTGPTALVNRLRELGFVHGEKFKMVSRILWGQPLIVEVRGQTFALRLEEAKCIEI